MIYVISEDIGSGLSFWKIFFETYFKDYEIIKRAYSGNLTLISQLDEALIKASEKDIIFIAFDKVYSSEGFDTADFLNAAIEKCRRKKVKLYVTSYYCFEEIYLSYPELENLIRADGKDTSLADVARRIRELISKDNLEYFYDIKLREAIGEARKDALKNKEHFADAALYYLTKTISNGYFTIDKSKKNGITKCWTCSCETIQEKSKKSIEYMCEKCCFSMKKHNCSDKLEDLCSKSCIANSGYEDAIEVFATELQ